MKSKTLSLFGLSILALMLCISLASAVTIFSDDFNDGDLNGWTITNNPSSLPGTQWTAINNYAEAKPGNGSASPSEGTTTLQRIISSSGYESIIVGYGRQLEDFESSDFFNISWSIDGSTYTSLESNSTGGDSSFVSKSFNLPSSANNNANLRLKFD